MLKAMLFHFQEHARRVELSFVLLASQREVNLVALDGSGGVLLNLGAHEGVACVVLGQVGTHRSG